MEKRYTIVPETYYRITVGEKATLYSQYEELDDEFAKVMKDGKWGILNPNGTVWGKIEFTRIHDGFNDGFIRVEKDGKYGYADKETGRFIDCVFDYAEDFCNGVANVRYNGEERIINFVGKFVDWQKNKNVRFMPYILIFIMINYCFFPLLQLYF